ncbi:sensor histidine kinase [Amycolatopsis sp. NPDC059027]|uniref:sensor histidine kinase n=1 Tax=unclassified Amycolatopsis TaxID=2618356 RepID=UPI003670A41D
MTSSYAPSTARQGIPRWLFGRWLSRDFYAEYAWVFFSALLSVVSLVSVLAGFVLGVALSPLVVGLLVVSGAVQYARLLGGAHRRLAGRMLGVRAPAPRRAELKPGLWNWLKARAGDPFGWRSIGYFVLRLPLSVIGPFVLVSTTLFGFAAVTYPVLWPLMDGKRMPVFDIYSETWPGTLVWGVSGLLMLLALPWLVHGLVALDRLLVVALLGQRALSERVRDLEESRATAVEDAALRLRRIERDLHDGAQAQLVALAMRLGLAKDELTGDAVDVGQVRDLVTAAHANAKQALTELRDLARGIHPAALDAGLDIALSTLVASSGIDARIEVDLPRRPPPSIETIVYFSAAELLTNAAKHAGTPALATISEHDDVLRLRVSDGGPGGARIVAGGGLAGLADRLRTVDGELTVGSPAGGPTTVTAEIPLPR